MADNKQVENDEEIKTKSKAKLLLVIGIVIAIDELLSLDVFMSF